MKIINLSEACGRLDKAGKMINVGDNVIQDRQIYMRAKDKAKFYTDKIISGLQLKKGQVSIRTALLWRKSTIKSWEW